MLNSSNDSIASSTSADSVSMDSNNNSLQNRNSFVRNVGAGTIALVNKIGHVAVFAASAIVQGLTPPYYPRLILQQLLRIGYHSLPVVGLTAFFTGSVLALQIYIGGSRFNSEQIVASIVALGITRELGPVLTGLMVAGRISAAIAAEIGTMRVSEQLDAMVTLSTNPMKYLVGPRVIAAIISLPLLVLVADSMGIMGGYLYAVFSLDFESGAYLRNTAEFIQMRDVYSGVIAGATFGAILSIGGCYFGYNCSGGAQGVGRAATTAVVTSSVLILASNYLLKSYFFAS